MKCLRKVYRESTVMTPDGKSKEEVLRHTEHVILERDGPLKDNILF